MTLDDRARTLGETEQQMDTLQINLLKDILKPSFTEELNDVEAQEFFNNFKRDFKAAGDAGDAGLRAWWVFHNAYWSALETAAHISAGGITQMSDINLSVRPAELEPK